MVVYAASPARRSRQVLADVLALVWVVAMVWVGRLVHRLTLHLGDPGRQLQQAGRDISRSLQGAADQVAGLPLVGDGVRGPLTQAASSTLGLVRAGQDLQTAVARVALLLGVLTAGLPILIMLALWLPARVRFIRRASAAQRFVDGDPDLDLFALRAMANQPMHVLAAISSDPAGAWRRGEPDVVRSLAVLELHSVGLRPPPPG